MEDKKKQGHITSHKNIMGDGATSPLGLDLYIKGKMLTEQYLIPFIGISYDNHFQIFVVSACP
jgi:hypothetical protein